MMQSSIPLVYFRRPLFEPGGEVHGRGAAGVAFTKYIGSGSPVSLFSLSVPRFLFSVLRNTQAWNLLR